MRHLLAIFVLLLALSAPQAAFAAPFTFSPEDGNASSIFQTDKSLFENLTALNNAAGGNASLIEAPLTGLTGTLFKFDGLGYSWYAQTYSLTVYNGNEPVGSIADGFDIAAHATINDLYIEYYDVYLGSLDRVALVDLDMTVLQLAGAMNFVLDGVNYALNGGIFFGFSIPGSGNGIDFILSGVPYAPAPAVPLPAGVWLFGTGMAGLFALRRRSSF